MTPERRVNVVLSCAGVSGRVLLFALSLVACTSGDEGAQQVPSSRAAPPAASARPSQTERASERCATEIETALEQEALPGAPALEASREEILARAKGRPVLFLRTPQRSEHSRTAEPYWRMFEAAAPSALSFYSSYSRLVRRPEVARELLLREGYLYSDQIQLAMGLSNSVRLEDLFDDKKLWIHRGGELIEAERHSEAGSPLYRYGSGEEKGQRATLLLFDRVSANVEDLKQPLHRDFSALQDELGFDAVRLEHLSEQSVVAHLQYGSIWVRTLLHGAERANLRLQCEVVAPSEEAEIARVRTHNRSLARVVDKLHETVLVQLEESLPFDEPKTEFGQEDGKLRQEWRLAYRFGQSFFEYNEDRYRVFDYQGRPRVPQVCIDFITDTLERASGTWYREKGEPRERIRGRLDFDDYAIENRRSVESFIGFAEAHPNWFEVHQLQGAERVPFRKRAEFIDYLKQNRASFQRGDIVVILGLRDDDREHYHSFFVYDVDPISRMPIWLASNAGRPRIRVWENELGNAPKRSIKARIRPLLPWLAQAVLGEPAP